MEYKVNDKVIVRNYDNHEVGVITELHFNSKKKLSGYTLMLERGSELIFVGVDNAKSSQTIDSHLTNVVVESSQLNTNLTTTSLGNYAS